MPDIAPELLTRLPLWATGRLRESQPAARPQFALWARGQLMRWRALPSYAEPSRSPMLLREPLAGTTVQTIPGTFGHLPAWFSQFKCMNRPGKLGAILAAFRLTSEGPQVRTLLRPPGQRVFGLLGLVDGEPNGEPKELQWLYGGRFGQAPRAW